MARRHDLIQLKKQRGQRLTTFINNLMILGSEADVWELKLEDWMANLEIAGADPLTSRRIRRMVQSLGYTRYKLNQDHHQNVYSRQVEDLIQEG